MKRELKNMSSTSASYKEHLKRTKLGFSQSQQGGDLPSSCLRDLNRPITQATDIIQELCCKVHPGKRVVAVTLDPKATNRLLCIYCLNSGKHNSIIEVSECLNPGEIDKLTHGLHYSLLKESITEDPTHQKIVSEINQIFDELLTSLTEIRDTIIKKLVNDMWKAPYQLMNYNTVHEIQAKLQNLLTEFHSAPDSQPEEFWDEYTHWLKKATVLQAKVRTIQNEHMIRYDRLALDLQTTTTGLVKELRDFTKTVSIY